MIHHIATIFLIGFSYCTNFVRVGTFAMMVHDSSDFLLEVKTSFSSSHRRRISEILLCCVVASRESMLWGGGHVTWA